MAETFRTAAAEPQTARPVGEAGPTPRKPALQGWCLDYYDYLTSHSKPKQFEFEDRGEPLSPSEPLPVFRRGSICGSMECSQVVSGFPELGTRLVQFGPKAAPELALLLGRLDYHIDASVPTRL